MSDIEEKELSILHLAREEFTPGQSERARVRAALAATVGVSTAAASGSAAAAGAAAAGGAKAMGKVGAAGNVGAAGSAKTLLAVETVGVAASTSKLVVIAVGATMGVSAGVLALTPPDDAPKAADRPTLGARVDGASSAPSSQRVARHERVPSTTEESKPSTEAHSQVEVAPRAMAPSAPSPVLANDFGSGHRRVQPSEGDQRQSVRQHELLPIKAHPDQPTGLADSSADSGSETQGDSLVEGELALLGQARRSLNQGNGVLVLSILAELDQKYPQGMFVEERRATRVLALCTVGQVARARSEMLRFSSRYPQSVYADRILDSCAAKER